MCNCMLHSMYVCGEGKWVHIYMRFFVYVCMFVFVCMFACVCACLPVCVHARTCVCRVCVWMCAHNLVQVPSEILWPMIFSPILSTCFNHSCPLHSLSTLSSCLTPSEPQISLSSSFCTTFLWSSILA